MSCQQRKNRTNYCTFVYSSLLVQWIREYRVHHQPNNSWIHNLVVWDFLLLVFLICQSRLNGDSHIRRKLSCSALCPYERCLMRGRLQVLRADRQWKICRHAPRNHNSSNSDPTSHPLALGPWQGRGYDHLAARSLDWLQSRSWLASCNLAQRVDCAPSSR